MGARMERPTARPGCANFSSGPCAKRPGWSVDVLRNALVGRSHRSEEGKARLKELSDRMRRVLGLPSGYRIGVVAGSDTGAMELALWTLLGPRPVDMFAWEAFGQGWIEDAVDQLKLPEVRRFESGYGRLPDLRQADPAHDIVFTLNGTTSGVKVPDLDWIAAGRGGLSICDATSGIFAMELDYSRLDAVTFSWQKVLGGEAGHGVIILSPRAVRRMEENSARAPWPLPKLFRLAAEGKLKPGELECSTVNTPSLLCVEGALDALRWAQSIGGLPALITRSRANLAVLEGWAASCGWAAFLAEDKAIRSSTSVCLRITTDWFTRLPASEQRQAADLIASRLAEEGAAFDISAYAKAPAGLRIWCGATVETSDIQALTPWLDWAHDAVAREYAQGTAA
ncbi:MAG: phosphoserine transaminase [Elusimicrobia bacterium]|nr:phosphoserine transaminase [Elusimicrobiota bacterium]